MITIDDRIIEVKHIESFFSNKIMYDIVVLGAGAVGLSTAVNIQKLVPDRHVTIIADKFTKETTSDGAAGMFRVTLELTPEKSVERFRKWCLDSWDWYHEVSTKYDPRESGIIRVSGYEFPRNKRQFPYHHNIIYDFREMTERELKSFPGNHKYGWKYTTLMTESRRYLPWLTNRFLASGGRIEDRTVENIQEFAGNCALLVNCCGIGSAKLFNDQHVYPVRGHLLRVKAPWLKHFIVADDADTYIYTGQDNVVLGGTRHKGVYDKGDSDPWFEDVLRRCKQQCPGLEGAEIEGKWVGLRPHRTSIRIESETLKFDGKVLKVVHNYGHGANGIALSWGTSVEAARIARGVLPDPPPRAASKL